MLARNNGVDVANKFKAMHSGAQQRAGQTLPGPASKRHIKMAAVSTCVTTAVVRFLRSG